VHKQTGALYYIEQLSRRRSINRRAAGQMVTIEGYTGSVATVDKSRFKPVGAVCDRWTRLPPKGSLI
jgi:hypothetical protein